MKYRVKLTCSECTGGNIVGCGKGEPWFITVDDGDAKLFESREDADAAGLQHVSEPTAVGAPYFNWGTWSFKVEEVAA